MRTRPTTSWTISKQLWPTSKSLPQCLFNSVCPMYGSFSEPALMPETPCIPCWGGGIRGTGQETQPSDVIFEPVCRRRPYPSPILAGTTPCPECGGSPLIRRHTPNWARLTQTEEPFDIRVDIFSCLPHCCDARSFHQMLAPWDLSLWQNHLGSWCSAGRRGKLAGFAHFRPAVQAGLRMAAVSRSGRTSRIRPRKYLEYPSQMPRNEEAGGNGAQNNSRFRVI